MSATVLAIKSYFRTAPVTGLSHRQGNIRQAVHIIVSLIGARIIICEGTGTVDFLAG